jgi:hypothetical protein
VDIPELVGPAGFGLGLVITAVPDIISADGFSTSAVRVTLRNQDGAPISGAEVFLTVADQDGAFGDIGTLQDTATQVRGTGTGIIVRTGSDGTAQAIYRAPARTDFTANRFVVVAGRPVSTDAGGQGYRSVRIELRSAEPRLFPQNPENDDPICNFTVEAPARPGTCTGANPPACTVPVNSAVLFQTAAHDPDGTIVRYEWFFGDGTTVVYAPDTAHVFRTPGTYAVTHRVTDNNGRQAACQATLTAQ